MGKTKSLSLQRMPELHCRIMRFQQRSKYDFWWSTSTRSLVHLLSRSNTRSNGAHLNTPKTLEECEALCDAHPECASFVVDQMGGGKCHLRTECPLVNEDCIEASSWGFINYVKEDCDSSAPTSLPDDLPSDIPSGSQSYAP